MTNSSSQKLLSITRTNLSVRYVDRTKSDRIGPREGQTKSMLKPSTPSENNEIIKYLLPSSQ